MNRRGFTLIEILLVIVILAVLTGMSLPMLVKALEKAKVQEAMVNLEYIRAAEKRYFLANGTYALDLDYLNIDNSNDAENRYFDYTIEVADNNDFTAKAQRRSDAPGIYNTYSYIISKDGEITSPEASPLL